MSDKVGTLIEEVAERLGEFGVGAQYSDDPWDSLEVETERGNYYFTPGTDTVSTTWAGSLGGKRKRVRIATMVDSSEENRNVIAAGIYFELLRRHLLPEGHDQLRGVEV